MPGGGPSAASSLYSGIFNKGEEELQASSSKTPDEEKRDAPLLDKDLQVEKEAVKSNSSDIAAASSNKPQGSAFYGIHSSIMSYDLLLHFLTNGIGWAYDMRLRRICFAHSFSFSSYKPFP